MRGSRARYTLPMPPAPIAARTSYGPSLSPAERTRASSGGMSPAERSASPVHGEPLGARIGSSWISGLLRSNSESRTGSLDSIFCALLPSPEKLAVNNSRLVDGATTSMGGNIELLSRQPALQ